MNTDISASLDLDFIRQQFPALAGEWIFFDNAGGSQTLRSVADRISDYLLTSNVQHGASYAVSQTSMARVAEATQAMATLINAADPQEIVMGPSTTQMFRILSLCLVRTLQPGDEIIVSNSDHEANVSPWTDLQRNGITVKIWQLNPETLKFDTDDLERLMTKRTRLVTLTHTSNILGTINPIKEIAAFVHERGALICVDGVAHAPHRLIDVQDLDVDFYCFSSYKVYGPHYAVLYGKKRHLHALPGINHYFIQEDDLPYKFQPGNVNFELAYGLLGLTDYLQQVAQAHDEQPPSSLRASFAGAFDLFARHEEHLSSRLLDFLNQKSSVRIIGETSASRTKRVPTISFVVEGIDSSEIVRQTDPHRIGIRFGDFYAKKLIHDLGLEPQNGVVRVSMVHYNTLEEVDRLIKALDYLR